MTNKKSNIKKRNWAFILYPESAPENWLDVLRETGLPCAISPLHDKDIDPNNEPKKAHYHIILSYAGPTSLNVIKNITDKLNAPMPQALEQIRGYYRYFTHKDNADKYQYDEKEIHTINGFDISNFIELSKSEISQIKIKLQNLIRENNIVEYSDLMDYLLDSQLTSEYDVASNHTYFFDKYISSKRNKALKINDFIKNKKINKETGEIIE